MPALSAGKADCHMMRSLLFTPGESLKKMDTGAAGPADALILDLEGSIAPARGRPRARSSGIFCSLRPHQPT
jgi:citrate lyase subunit beta / citryl-CoA lyase